MISSSSFEWREHLVLSRDLQVAGERGEFFRRVRTGEFVAIYRGAYVRASEWEAMGRDARYLARIRAATAYAREPLIFSHESAAALWRLPSVEPWPRRVHCLSQNSAGGRSNGMFVRHTVGVPDEVATVDGLAVTTMSRTVVDLAAASASARLWPWRMPHFVVPRIRFPAFPAPRSERTTSTPSSSCSRSAMEPLEHAG